MRSRARTHTFGPAVAAALAASLLTTTGPASATADPAATPRPAAATGDAPDLAWGNCGWVTTDVRDGGYALGAHVDTQVGDDGRVVVLGAPTDRGAVVVSLAPNGTPDRAWGERGVAFVDLPGTTPTATFPRFEPRSLGVLPDGGVAVAGLWYADEAAPVDVGVARLLADGSLDPAFGAAGLAVLGTDGRDDPLVVAAGTAGRLYVLYETTQDPGGDAMIVVAALAPDGTLDPAFAGGQVTPSVEGEEIPSDLVVTADGRPWLVGVVNGAGELFLARWTLDGALDTTLGGSGIVRHAGVPRWQGRSAGLDAAGGVVVAVDEGARLVRFDRAGAPDLGYGTDGAATTGIVADAFVAGPAGVAVVDIADGPSWSDPDYTIVRIDEAGQPLPGFGDAGRLVRPTALDGLRGYRPVGVALSPDGEVVVAGGATRLDQPTIVTERFRSDGSLDALDCPERRTGLQVVRRSGKDRFATAAAISAGAFPRGAPVVFVATGGGFADALAAGPAAAYEGGPVLLVTRDAIPAPTAAELTRLAPERIVVVGGKGVIADRVLEQLRASTGSDVTRIAGTDRFDTAAKLAQTVFTHGVDEVLLATGANFPDALAGGAAAGSIGAPILLVTRDQVPTATGAALDAFAPERIATLGGRAVISWELVGELRERFPQAEVVPLQGPDRYATAQAIARHYFEIPVFDPEVVVHTVYLATGLNFPDALAGAAAAGAAGAPLLLSPPDRLGEIARGAMASGYAARAVLLGGDAALSPAVEQRLKVPGIVDHRFLNHVWDAPDVYTRWNPCEPIRWVYNPADEPAGGRADLDEAIRRLERATGLTLAYEGTTTEPWDPGREPYQPDRYGDRWAPVWIGWAGLSDAGLGGHTYVGRTAVSGVTVLDPGVGMVPGFDEPYAYGPVFMHELGHMVGLDHVASSSHIMYSGTASDSATDWAPGDLLGLRGVGREAGCLEVPDPSTMQVRTASSVVSHRHHP